METGASPAPESPAGAEVPADFATPSRALSTCTIAVVGLGLMGGSLAGALKGHCHKVVGVDPATTAREGALSCGYVDRATASLAEGVRDADVVVLAAPVRTIIQLIGTIGPLLSPGTVLMDLGSTKTDVLAAMAGLPSHVQPLGGHPMCGKETSGIAAADPELFRGRTFILSPLARTSTGTLALGKALVQAVGARPLVIDGPRQDYLVATLSHLPYLLACALISTADATTSNDPLAWEIIAGGFRDTSRVAGSDVTMMVDILTTNREEVLKAARSCLTHLERLIGLVDHGDAGQLQDVLSRIRDTRKEMYP